ncbi:hypothetical protein Dda_9023 [Drechslerella dactyloides]|uniref:C2H2-type domain-containing protein n=1 Tax=Drechslerella dactyloides TaxID=74499 RepID=A0AAD6IPS0_DREDA|nr:hypothetical protein Dda_9023 [Drechslerella dactyloides]
MTTLVASPNPHPAPALAAASSHPFTCNTCQVAFKSSDGQRTHMHTDWHRYNLKRRIAELPPISSEIFAEKVLSSQAADRAARDRASFEKLCQPCSRTYYSQNAYNNHVNSQKHKQRLAALDRAARADGESVMSSTFSMDDTAIPDRDDDEMANRELASLTQNLRVTPSTTTTTTTSAPAETEDGMAALPITECLFCGLASTTLQQNLEHMSKSHGLFIPEQRYLVNLEGLVRYLGQKVLVGNTCLYCNKAKGGLDGIRTHMRDKGHCMIAFDTEDEMLEIGEFYDFRSTYDDSDAASNDDDGTWEDEQGNKAAGHDETWETDSEASSVDSCDIGSLRVTRKATHHRTSSSHHLEDGWHSHAHSHSHTHAVVYFTETEMHLPTGRDDDADTLAIEDGDAEDATAGNSNANSSAAQRRAQKALISRANGGQGLALASAGAKARASKMEKKDKAVEERGREKYRAKIEKAANHQKHYREQRKTAATKMRASQINEVSLEEDESFKIEWSTRSAKRAATRLKAKDYHCDERMGVVDAFVARNGAHLGQRFNLSSFQVMAFFGSTARAVAHFFSHGTEMTACFRAEDEDVPMDVSRSDDLDDFTAQIDRWIPRGQSYIVVRLTQKGTEHQMS